MQLYSSHLVHFQVSCDVTVPVSGLTRAIMEEILETFLRDINGDNHVIGGLGKADINQWIVHGVPGASLYTNNSLYFYYHHTEGSSIRHAAWKPIRF